MKNGKKSYEFAGGPGVVYGLIGWDFIVLLFLDFAVSIWRIVLIGRISGGGGGIEKN